MRPHKPTYAQATSSEPRLGVVDKGRTKKANQVEETLNQQPTYTNEAVKVKRKKIERDVPIFLGTGKEDLEKFLR
jgi:hypothetical protein